jgi:hypothetical protein
VSPVLVRFWSFIVGIDVCSGSCSWEHSTSPFERCHSQLRRRKIRFVLTGVCPANLAFSPLAASWFVYPSLRVVSGFPAFSLPHTPCPPFPPRRQTYLGVLDDVGTSYALHGWQGIYSHVQPVLSVCSLFSSQSPPFHFPIPSPYMSHVIVHISIGRGASEDVCSGRLSSRPVKQFRRRKDVRDVGALLPEPLCCVTQCL